MYKYLIPKQNFGASGGNSIHEGMYLLITGMDANGVYVNRAGQQVCLNYAQVDRLCHFKILAPADLQEVAALRAQIAQSRQTAAKKGEQLQEQLAKRDGMPAVIEFLTQACDADEAARLIVQAQLWHPGVQAAAAAALDEFRALSAANTELENKERQNRNLHWLVEQIEEFGAQFYRDGELIQAYSIYEVFCELRQNLSAGLLRIAAQPPSVVAGHQSVIQAVRCAVDWIDLTTISISQAAQRLAKAVAHLTPVLDSLPAEAAA